METLKELQIPDFTIGKIRYRVSVLKGMAGFNLLETIREAFSSKLSNAIGDGSDEARAGAQMMSAVMSVDRIHVMKVWEAVQECIEVKLPNTDRFVSLSSAYALWEQEMEPLDLYEVLVRAVAVNFTKSIQDLMSRLGLDRGLEEPSNDSDSNQ